MKIHEMSVRQLTHAIESGQMSARGVVQHFAEAVEQWGELNALQHWDIDIAREQARRSDDKPTAGPLGGIPILLKDNIVDTTFTTRCASHITGDFESFFDATVVSALDEAGALRFGKTNMDEFAMGSSGEHSAFGKTHNPWRKDVVPGGSSSGSAAAVAAGMAPAALGSDTGGSIRQPAAFCGVVGMKPTYGRVSRRGLVAYGSSLDQIGPMARRVADAAEVYQAIAGFDPRDSTSVRREVPDVCTSLGDGCADMTFGIPKEYMGDGISPDIREALQKVRRSLESQGARIVDISLPHTKYAVAAYYIIATAEASSNLSRFDGVRYGHRTKEAQDIHELYARSRAEGFGEEVVRRILLGTFVLSSGYYDAYYRRAQQVRRLVCEDFEQAFSECDILLTPTTPTAAFSFGRTDKDPTEMYMADVFTVPANLAGLPGISVPATLSEQRLPTGVQFLAPLFHEAALFRAAYAWESARGEFPMPNREDFLGGGCDE